MFTLLKKSTPSVFCLIVALFCVLTPLFSQTEAINTADKALEMAKKNNSTATPYATALRDLWQGYHDYIVAENAKITDTMYVVLINQDAAYRLSMDSMVKAASKVNAKNTPKLWAKIQEKETLLYRDVVKSIDTIDRFYSKKSDLKPQLPHCDVRQRLFTKLDDKEQYFINLSLLAFLNRQLGQNTAAKVILENGIDSLSKELARFDKLPRQEKEKNEYQWLKMGKYWHVHLVSDLCETLTKKGDFDTAILVGKKGVMLMKDCLKDSSYKNSDFGNPHCSLAKVYNAMYKLDSAIIIALEGLAFYPRISNPTGKLLDVYTSNSNPYLDILYCLNSSYLDNGDMVNCKKTTFEIYEIAQTQNVEEIMVAKLRLYLFFLKIGQYDEAAQFLNAASEDALKIHGKDSFLGEAAPNEFKAILYASIGEYGKAEKYLKASILLSQKLGMTLTELTQKESTLARIYESTGRYSEALAIRRKINAATISDNKKSSSWLELGKVYHRLKQLDSARFCYNQSYAIYNSIGKKTTDIVNVLNRLGGVEEIQHNYAYAEKLYREGISYMDSLTMPRPQEKGSWLLNFSRILRKNEKDIDKSLEYAQKSLVILRGVEITTDYRKAQLNRALLHEVQKQNPAAIDSLKSMWQGIETRIVKEFGYLSEQEKVAFMTMLDGDFFGTMQAAYARLYVKGEAAKSGSLFYNTALLQKELSLMDTRSLKRKVANLNDTLLSDKLFKLNSFEEQIKSDKPIPTADRERLATEVTQIKADLEKMYPKLFEKEWLKTNWQDIKQKLKKGEIAIEFADVLNNDDDTTSIRNYYAVIVKADSEYPTLVPLFEEHALTKILEESLVKQIINRPNRREVLIDDAETMKKRYGTEYGTKLYNLVWKPLENANILRGVKRVHFAPSGLLNRVSFAALPVNDTLRTLLENYELRQYNSTRDITEAKPRTPEAQEEAVIFGGIRYNEDSISIAEVATQLPENDITSLSRSALSLDSVLCWDYLPHTLREVKTIDSLYKRLRPSVRTSLKTGINALEENAKALSKVKRKSPRTVHFATHSFSNPSNYVESKYAAATLHRAGLVMANADWQGCKHQKPLNDMDDGILTAFEIAQLNLSNTELVVMSSCQSALGDISSGREGVFGLTRGFKLAGVEYVLASLWKVKDEEAAEFMTAFYSHYLKGKAPVEAFELTQKERGKSDKGVDAWAAWVLIR